MATKQETQGTISSIGQIRKEEDYRRRITRLRYVLASMLAFSAVVFLVIAWLAILKEGAGAFIATIESMNVGDYLIALGILFVGYLIRFPKWQVYLRRLQIKVDIVKSFLVYLSMYSMDITPGRWGRAVVGVTLNRLTGVRFGKTFPAIVADIFTDFLGFAVLTILALIFVRKYIVPSVVAAVLLMLPFIFMYHRKPFEYARRKLSRFRFMKKFFEVGAMYFKEKDRLGGDVYVYSLLYTVPAMFLNSASFFFIMLAFGVHLTVMDIPLVVFIFTSATLFGMITGVPGTLGVTDAVLLGYLLAFFGSDGVTFGVASAITIFSRIANIWFVQLFGGASLAYTFRYWKH